MCSIFISNLMFCCVYSVNKNVELFRASLNDAFITVLCDLMRSGILIEKVVRYVRYTPVYCGI